LCKCSKRILCRLGVIGHALHVKDLLLGACSLGQLKAKRECDASQVDASQVHFVFLPVVVKNDLFSG
jgi:hypothetical protein